MEEKEKQSGYKLPERSPNIIRNWWDFLVLTVMLGKPISWNKSLGDFIETRGISRKYIIDLYGRYDRKSIEKYINALADIRGNSYDEILGKKI